MSSFERDETVMFMVKDVIKFNDLCLTTHLVDTVTQFNLITGNQKSLLDTTA